MMEKMKGVRKLPEVQEIFAPGEHGNTLTDNALASDSIEIEENLYKKHKAAAQV